MTVQEYLEIYHKCPDVNDNSKYHTHYEDEHEDQIKLEEYNKKLIEQYPWLLPRNRWTDKVAEDYNYHYTELDDMPKGWRIAFGEDICKEIQEELQKFDFSDKYRITQIEEKYGGLRWYDGGIPKDSKIWDIIKKYEAKSYHTCICCGKPAKWSTVSWISPYCDDCKTELENNKEFYDRFEEIDSKGD